MSDTEFLWVWDSNLFIIKLRDRGLVYLRHDPRQVKDLRWEVSHVTVEEDEQRLDDARVWGEAGRKSSHDAVDDAHHDTSQGNHEERDDTEDGAGHGNRLLMSKFLKQVIQDLEQKQECLCLLLVLFMIVLWT